MGRHFLDISGEHCPMTFVKVKLKMEDLQNGDELEIVLTGQEPIENVPKAVIENGLTIINQVHNGKFLSLLVKKEG